MREVAEHVLRLGVELFGKQPEAVRRRRDTAEKCLRRSLPPHLGEDIHHPEGAGQERALVLPKLGLLAGIAIEKAVYR